MKAFRILVGVIVAISTGGCVEGVDYYYFHGKVVDFQTGKPLAGAKVLGLAFRADGKPFEPEYLDKQWKSCADIRTGRPEQLAHRKFVTDEGGEFALTAGQLLGGPGLFFFPAPPELTEVTLYVGKEGKWQEIIVPVAKSQQTRHAECERWVEVGVVRCNPGAPVARSRPNAH